MSQFCVWRSWARPILRNRALLNLTPIIYTIAPRKYADHKKGAPNQSKSNGADVIDAVMVPKISLDELGQNYQHNPDIPPTSLIIQNS